MFFTYNIVAALRHRNVQTIHNVVDLLSAHFRIDAHLEQAIARLQISRKYLIVEIIAL